MLAAALLTIGEMKLASGAWEISFGLAPADKQGQYQGFFGTGPAVARMLGGSTGSPTSSPTRTSG